MGKLLDLFLHPDELVAAFQAKYMRQPFYPRDKKKESATLKRCYELLDKTSRSFAAVIQELHPELRDTVMLFYVILRGLDTIEDDMTIDNEKKLPMLRDFHNTIQTPGWTFDGSSEKDAVVLEEFDKVVEEFGKIKKSYREVIIDITHKMGHGMADYIVLEQQKNYEGVKTIQDYTTYCHHVAGVVGEGITRLALLSKFGTNVLSEKPQLMESMGQFLQKTNIIRDYREDLDDGRSFWPKEVWGKYAKQLSDFKNGGDQALFCVSDLVCLSLEHVTELLEYLQNVEEQTLFSFCAIPQVMSIATLELVFNNPEIFKRNVKIRRGTSAKLIMQSDNMAGVFEIFKQYTRKIHLRNRSEDPNFMRIEVLCGKIEQYINKQTLPPPKTAEQLEQERMERNILLAGGAGLAFCASIMIFLAWCFGARFEPIFYQMQDFMYQTWNTPGEHMPGYEQRMAEYGRPVVKSVKSAASAVKNEL